MSNWLAVCIDCDPVEEYPMTDNIYCRQTPGYHGSDIEPDCHFCGQGSGVEYNLETVAPAVLLRWMARDAKGVE